MSKYSLLQKLCEIHAPSGSEGAVTRFLIDYVETHAHTWKCKPRIYSGKGFQDTLILVFGAPKTVIYAHMDTVGYMAGYNTKLIDIGSPKAAEGTKLIGTDSLGAVECSVVKNEQENSDSVKTKQVLHYHCNRDIERGTTLTYKPHFLETDYHITANNLDNRLGVWAALQVAESLEHGVIAFSCYEETGGGTVQFLHRYLYKKYRIRQALIADITWITEGIQEAKGGVISLHDSCIPRREYVQKILSIAKRSQIPFQIEVESGGGSDGSVLQHSCMSVDWCFVGIPIEGAHSPSEKVHKDDIHAMVKLYTVLMKEL